MSGAPAMEIIKFRSQLFIAFEQAKVRLYRAQNALPRLKRVVANRARGLGYVLRAKAKVRLYRAQNALPRLKRIVANRARGLGYAVRAKAKVRLYRAQNALPRLKRVVANRARGLGYAVRAKAKVRLYQAQDALAILADKARGLGDVLRAKVIDSGQWLGGVLDAIVVMMDKTRKFTSRLLVASEQLTVKNRFAVVRRNLAEKPRRLQETLHARENVLPKLLEDSNDAMVVMNKELRFVGANAKALDVFGISGKNMTMFSMDAFLRGQILPFDENGTLFTSQKEWHGECRIQRLDGSVRVAEFIFVANYVPLLHVCTFRNYRKWQREKRFAA
jgi:PAS domain-containing protein